MLSKPLRSVETLPVEDFGPEMCVKSFGDFLGDRLGLSEEELPRAGQWSGSGNAIGSLSLRLGLLTLEQVGRTVDMHISEARPFGETAVALGYMTEHHVKRVLQLQRFYRCLDLGGILMMQGKLELQSLLRLIAEFLQQELASP